ncbi:MAG TPA: hypothetical protein VK427_09690 [Kofleriaceae bacterium]|nr:hypothetical protein [Kofleriaceae bacterium]
MTTANGTLTEVAAGVVPHDTDWFGAANRLLAVSRRTEDVAFAAVENGTARWREQVSLARVQAVTYLGDLDGAWLFALARRESTTVVAVDFDKRRVASLARTQAGRGAFDSVTKQLAVMGRSHAEIWDLPRQRLVRRVRLPPISERTAYSDSASLGFDGKVIWMYLYAPPNSGDSVIVVRRRFCAYDVYDATSGALLRTMKDASGQWRSLAADCRIRALLPRENGRVLAIRVDGPEAGSATMFERAP